MKNRDCKIKGSSWALRLSWVENAYSRPIFCRFFSSKVGHTDLVFDVPFWFITVFRSVHARGNVLHSSIG